MRIFKTELDNYAETVAEKLADEVKAFLLDNKDFILQWRRAKPTMEARIDQLAQSLKNIADMGGVDLIDKPGMQALSNLAACLSLAMDDANGALYFAQALKKTSG